ncbi:MAG: site-specific DNA-methyltransferase, partial [Candidatus Marinimicrobia bacterium]|nr:site-specific DNA-methyltransferase [Candidatus Neomarinimicrobiota bacterium]
NDAKWLSDNHDHILTYACNKEKWRPNLLPRTEASDKRYKNPDKDQRGLWMSSDLSVKTYMPETDYPITTPSGRVINPAESRCWGVSKEKFEELVNDNRIWFGKNGTNVPRLKRFLSEVQEGLVSKTIWYRSEVGDNQQAKREGKAINPNEPFNTPKPERLIQRILHLATNEGDLVLDSFLGSGTTAAVAHKMGRKYIGVEMEKHAETHCALRLKKVIEGEQGGISKAVNWTKGGGFDYYRLGETVFESDGKIRKTISFKDLARHVFYSALNVPLDDDKDFGKSPLLGIHNDTAVYLLYNGVLKDKSPNGGNALTRKVLAELQSYHGQKIIYGTSCRLSHETLRQNQITFKQIPYHIKVS